MGMGVVPAPSTFVLEGGGYLRGYNQGWQANFHGHLNLSDMCSTEEVEFLTNS